MKQLLFIFSIGLLSLLSACVTKNGTPTKLGKFYHNVTGKYNAYYNADLLLMESFESLNNAHRDNYNQLLALYPYAAVENASSANASLDEAIKKCAINIELHRPSNWVDDSYFIIGRAEFLKQEYEKSTATFKYIVDKYNPEKPLSAMSPEELEAYKKAEAKKRKGKKKKKKKKRRKKRKKKKKKKKKVQNSSTTNNGNPEAEEENQRPKRYFLKHRPVRQRAMLWLAKSYVANGQYDEAGTYLRIMAEDKTVARRLKAEVFAVTAYSAILQKNLEAAVAPLDTAISLTRNKKRKTRYVYVLAQLHEELGNSQLAMENFRKTLRLRPTYEMEFNARLNMATNAADVEEVKMNPEMALKRMLKDPKNEEYKDQIYFALAMIQFKSGSKENGILALKQAMANSASNSFQRVEASYMLAEIYYEQEAYVDAYHYYDTASTTMSKEDERSAYVIFQKSQLKDLADNIQIVVAKDSLLAIADWEYDKQRELVQRMRQEENKAKKSSKNNRNRPSPGGVSVNSNTLNQSKFQLYNANMVKRGERDFAKRWGTRSYSDNWRRSSNSTFDAGDNELASSDNSLPPVTKQDVTDYLKKMGVPQDDKAKDKMKGDIEKSLFLTGSLYYERLQKEDKAMNAFNDLLQRFPKSTRRLEALYMMYNIATNQNKIAAANQYKQQILADYPESDIAKALKDPDFLNAKEKELAEINQYYEDTYAMIQDGKSADAFKRIENLSKKFGNDYPMKPRFALLAAMCQGGIHGIDEYVRALKTVVSSFPDTDEQKKAQEMIALLTGKNTRSNPRNPSDPKNVNTLAKGDFVDKMQEGHYILIAFDDPKAKVNEFKGKIATYNSKNFSLLRLNISSLMLDGNIPTLIVRKFRSGKDAQDYYKTVEGNKEFLGEAAAAHKVYFIGQSNYRQILQKRNFSAYINFFDETYGDQ